MAGSRNRRARNSSSGASWGWRALRFAGIICFFSLSLVAMIAVLIQYSALTLGKNTSTGSASANSTCAKLSSMTTDPNDPSGTVVWVTVKSSTAADVMAAVKCTPMFQHATVGDDLIARAMRSGHLANPVLIKAYRHDVGLADIWLVPVVDKNNLPLAMLACDYDEHAHELRAGEFAAVTGNMFYVTHTFPALGPSVAASAVSHQHHVALSSRAADLIYFPADEQSLVTGKQKWQGGGTSFLDPIWRVADANGKWHYVDHSGHAHLASELPLTSGYLAMPTSIAVQ